MRLATLLAAAWTLIAAPAMAWAAPTAAAIIVRAPVIHPAAKGGATAVYMTVMNTTARPLTLVGARCGCAASVMAHQSSMRDGTAHMQATQVVVPAHGSIAFTPGGLHLMVMGLKQPIRLGDRVSLTLSFSGVAPVTARFTAAR